jgi:hypothetical protein
LSVNFTVISIIWATREIIVSRKSVLCVLKVTQLKLG